MKTQEIDLLQGLVSIIKQHDGAFTQEDISLIKGINQIINSSSVCNWARGQFDESKVNRDEQGRFAEKAEQLVTPREAISLYIIARGENNKAISEELSYSQHTIKSDISKILKKLDAKNRTDAVVQAIRYGILDPNQVEVKVDENKRRQNELSKVNRTLKEREKDLLLYLAAGSNVKQVGEEIWGKSEALAKSYKQNILDKFEVNDETAAVIIGLQHKIITIDEIMKIRKDL